MAGDKVLHFDNSNFEADVLNSDVPVLVDFWAEWCAPCRMLTPVIEELADEYQGRAKVGKVNCDSAAQVAAQFGIRSIPTVILFDKGQPIESFVGLRQKGDYQAVLNAQLGAG